ncbi:MAG: S-layer homology domain-containing protein [Clostridia bacterium]|nr:S-layer homology domain-containing protein [Clostridia bacterium]
MLKKFICTILSASLLFVPMSFTASAATFPDVTTATHAWAYDAIEELVEDGVIKGYTDNTFKPDRTISKTEALVLSARIVGYTNQTVAPFVSLATSFYEDVLEKYETPYKGEVSFLLYKGILSEKELPYYLSSENANTGMKRYEVAKLLTKVIGGEGDIDESATTADYSDSAEIPADAKPYVRFVTDAGLMNGMGQTANGTPFAPMQDVTRAQIATLLYRLRRIVSETYIYGTVKEVDSENDVIRYTEDGETSVSLEIPFDVDPMIKQDGYSTDLTRIFAGAEVLIVKRGGVVYAIETISHMPDETVKGVISSITLFGDTGTIAVADIGDSSNAVTYTFTKDVAVLYQGNAGKLSDLKRTQAVTLQIRNKEVISIEATESERTIKGTVDAIAFEPKLSFSILLTNGQVESYPVANDATAKRNNVSVDVDKILVGDKVTIVLRYDTVQTVTATSTKYILEGTIDEITIATLPSIKIRANNAVSSYSLSRDCEYTVDGAKGDIYSLRLGAAISASVDSDTVTSLTAKSPAATAAIVGKIETVNNAYGFFSMIVTAADGSTSTMQVFTKRSNLKIINSADATNKKPSDLKEGMSVSVIGAITTGAFEATVITIMPE